VSAAVLGCSVLGSVGCVWPKPRPGRKNVAGETLPEVLMPLQPVPNAPNASKVANGSHFQFTLTQ